MALVLGCGRGVLFNSHAHYGAPGTVKGAQGALLAVSGPATSVEDIARYVCEFVSRFYKLQIRDAHMCLLERTLS